MSDAASNAQASVIPGFETGVFLAVNAIENAVLILNAPRCPFVRGLKVFMHNDLASSVYRSSGRHRVITSEWLRFEDVAGDEAGFGRLLTELTAGHPERWVFTSQNVSGLATGFDLEGLTLQTARRTGLDLVPLDGPRLGKDHLAGYDEVVSKVLERILHPDGRAIDLLLTGHLMCRNEADERANLAELDRLLTALGVGSRAILLSGGPLSLERLQPARVISMPYAGRRSLAALDRAGLAPQPVGLPLGPSGTSAWLRQIGQTLGRQQAAEALIEAELASLERELGWLVAEHLLGRRVILVADGPLGQALDAFLQELGMNVVAVMNVSAEPPDIDAGRLIQDPSAERFAAEVEGGQVDLVVGNGVFKHLTLDGPIPYLELGFPAYLTHALHPRPYLGFGGVRTLVEALLNGLLERDQHR